MDDVRNKFELRKRGQILFSKENRASYDVGSFTMPSLSELRHKASKLGLDRPPPKRGVMNFTSTRRTNVAAPTTSLDHLAIGDVFDMHSDPKFAHATFMAASQFNCLEFPSPRCTPEEGVTDYEYDYTQGPSCALAAGPATVFRNYLVDWKHGDNNVVGQSEHHQINNLEGVLQSLDVPNVAIYSDLVTVTNGYTESTNRNLCKLNQRLSDPEIRAMAEAQLRIGWHKQVEVPWAHGMTYEDRFTLANTKKKHYVTQAFCSALSCGYSRADIDMWELFATLVLDATYEAVLWAAAIDAANNAGSGTVILCALGGGVFRNKKEWIASAIGKAVVKCQYAGIHVIVAHFERVDAEFQNMIDMTIDQRAN